jgi:hypothetical protein
MIHLALSWGVGVTHLGGWVMDPLWRLDVRKMYALPLRFFLGVGSRG